MLFQCSLEIFFVLSISKKRDCLLSIAIAMAMSLCLDAQCFEVIVIRLESPSSDCYAWCYTQDRVVPHGLCVTPHPGYVATSISIAHSISYSQHRFSEIALRAHHISQQVSIREDICGF
jgi:hypothetical protein